MAVQKTKTCVKCKKTFTVVESRKPFGSGEKFSMKTTNGYTQGSHDEILHSLYCPTCREEKKPTVSKEWTRDLHDRD